MSLVRAMRKARKAREARDADLLTVGTVLDSLAFDLGEAHAEERRTGHAGDGAKGCIYCGDLREVKKAHAALARLGAFIQADGFNHAAPTGREGG